MKMAKKAKEKAEKRNAYGMTAKEMKRFGADVESHSYKANSRNNLKRGKC